jgi:hypothetical protein
VSSEHVVTPDEAGTRADVLVARLSGAARSLVADAVKRGGVRVNGSAVKASHPLESGDAVAYEIVPRKPLEANPEAIDIPIVYEDDDLLVVDKPAGMVTHPAHSATSGTLVNALLAHIGTLPGEPLRAGLVHRLDRDTSGLLVVAKTPEALSALGIAMKARRIKREYLGLVHGIPEHTRGTIDGPIGRFSKARRAALPFGNRPDAPNSRASRGDGPPDRERSDLRTRRGALRLTGAGPACLETFVCPPAQRARDDLRSRPAAGISGCTTSSRCAGVTVPRGAARCA